MNDNAVLRSPGEPEPGASFEVRIERTLRETIDRATTGGAPPQLGAGLAYAVFPGGARLRPRLCLAVAAACGEVRPALADAAAAAVELVHCGSLVHDDLPCFDDADLRRCRPTLHKVFGDATALLVGDALIVLAFETLARAGAAAAAVLLATGTGPRHGIIAGQAWESERAVPIEEYHRAKTAALFDAAAGMGALGAGADPEPWGAFGELVGRAYQAADDLADALEVASRIGKTAGRDAALNRPSVVRTYGVDGARNRVLELAEAARAAIPGCSNEAFVHGWFDALLRRMGFLSR